MLQSEPKHLPKLGRIRGGCYHHIRDVTQVGKVERAVMGGTVVTHEACAVNREDHRQVLKAHVVDNLIVRPLEERGVDGDDRPRARRCKARCECDGMLFCSAMPTS